eukprot:TRINITY_DN14130_c0_g2_i1.p1 TRINITY_DN14130_c0_g2~~TRINITY_DN14130_c0_g2_i1.p1  ORF type:complete len:189 (+),score=36.30 TRINITY_DN14130_c0_g2_i1:37-567(+)
MAAEWNTMLGYHSLSTPTASVDSMVQDMRTMSIQSGSGSWGSPREDDWRGGSSDEAPPLLSESEEEVLYPACNHNKWDNLRTKNEVVALRCRACSTQWKVPVDYIRTRKCEKFVKTCPVENCTYLHIYKYKLPAKTRSKLRQKIAKARELEAAKAASPVPNQCMVHHGPGILIASS